MSAKTTSIAVWLALTCTTLRGATAWSAGLDLTAESAFGLAGQGHSGNTIHGTLLAHLDWENANEDNGFTYIGTMSLLGVAGHGPTENFLNDFLAVSNIEAYRSARLYTWWGQIGGNDWSLRAGALLADEEFVGTDAAGGLINSGFGWPAFISANTVNTGPAYFVPAIGLRFERTFGGALAWRAGVFDGDTFDSREGDPTINDDGLHFELGGDQGWFLITELAWAPEASKTKLKAGAWYHTAGFADLRDDADGQPFTTSGNDPKSFSSDYGIYASVQRCLTGTSGGPGSVDAFARFGISPADRNTVRHAVDLGLAWTGPIPGRGGDVFSLGFVRADFSDKYSDAAVIEDPSAPAPDFEQVIESSYVLKWSDGVSVQPDLQYVFHPGGSAAQSDALIFLLRLSASY